MPLFCASHELACKKKEEYSSFFFWPISNFLAWYFCDAFSCQ